MRYAQPRAAYGRLAAVTGIFRGCRMAAGAPATGPRAPPHGAAADAAGR